MIVIFLPLLILFGCQGKEDTVTHHPITTLSQAYPGDIIAVDRLELVDGSSGDRIMMEDKTEIKEWIGLIKDLELTPDPNQEGRTGYIFGITLYEGEEQKLSFIPNYINNIYYQSNKEFEAQIRALFEAQFGREF